MIGLASCPCVFFMVRQRKRRPLQLLSLTTKEGNYLTIPLFVKQARRGKADKLSAQRKASPDSSLLTPLSTDLYTSPRLNICMACQPPRKTSPPLHHAGDLYIDLDLITLESCNILIRGLSDLRNLSILMKPSRLLLRSSISS